MNTYTRPCLRKGFTLTETIVVTTTTAFILVTLGMLLSYFYKTNAYTLEQSTAVAQARRGVEDSMRFLRQASYGSDGSYPIQSVATSSIIFYSNVVANTAIERVTYTLQQGTLYRVTAVPTGNPLSYATPNLSTSTIATSVVNATSSPLFRYFDSNGNELPTPVDVTKIASIQTTVVIDVNINRTPISFTLSGGATLRNVWNQL